MKAKLIRKTWMGEDIVAWCDVERTRLRRRGPFARTWAPIWDRLREAGYAVAGSSVPSMAMNSMQSASASATPFADPPKTAKLRVFQTQEVFGLVFPWWGIEGTGAAMEPPGRSAGPARLERFRAQDHSLSRSSPGDHGELS